MTVITLSREYGAGGRLVGSRVAEMLGIDFLDTALIEEVARRLHVTSETVEQWDERSESLIQRLLRNLQAAHPEWASASPMATEALNVGPGPERIWMVVQEVIREEARSRSAVILGRGGAFVLRHWPGVFHVRLVAPKEARVRRIAEGEGLDQVRAAKKLEAADRARDAFLHRCFGVDPSEAIHFGLVVNTEVLGIEGAARIIVEAAGAAG